MLFYLLDFDWPIFKNKIDAMYENFILVFLSIMAYMKDVKNETERKKMKSESERNWKEMRLNRRVKKYPGNASRK